MGKKQNGLSIIIPHHNEGAAFVAKTIQQIKRTVGAVPYEIIIVDDGSQTPLVLPDTDITVIHHQENKGVGASFDTGVSIANFENLILMGADIRFLDEWGTAMLAEINQHPTAFTCTSCVQLTPGFENIASQRTRKSVHAGADILLHHNHETNPKKPKNYRNILEARWLPALKNRDIDSFEISCVLGAFYGVKKNWYLYCHGFEGHLLWGTLEPYISLKSWMFGGSCRVVPRIEVGHIFKKVGTHGTPQWVIYYNKMLVATVLFENYQNLIDYIHGLPPKSQAAGVYNKNKETLLKQRQRYKQKSLYSGEKFF